MRKAVLFGQATEARQALLTINRCYSVVILRNHLKPDGFKSYIINKRLTTDIIDVMAFACSFVELVSRSGEIFYYISILEDSIGKLT